MKIVTTDKRFVSMGIISIDSSNFILNRVKVFISVGKLDVFLAILDNNLNYDEKSKMAYKKVSEYALLN